MIGIIYYGAGNIFSLSAALERLKLRYGIINQDVDFDQYDRYIIPGVGHASPAMAKLTNTGLIPMIQATQKPVLGICLGMQLLTNFSEEGNTLLTGIIPLKTQHFDPALTNKIPHMGWNKVAIEKRHYLLDQIKNEEYFYFVHSYFVEFSSNFTTASTEYGVKFSSIIQKNNFCGVQFHPEKSGQAGEQLLINFAK